MSKPPLTLQMPSLPDPVPVVLNPATTALLIFDVIDHISARQPICRETDAARDLTIAGAGTEGWRHHRVWDSSG